MATARAGEHLGFEQCVSYLLASVFTTNMEVSFGHWPQEEREDKIGNCM